MANLQFRVVEMRNCEYGGDVRAFYLSVSNFFFRNYWGLN